MAFNTFFRVFVSMDVSVSRTSFFNWPLTKPNDLIEKSLHFPNITVWKADQVEIRFKGYTF